MELSTGFIGVVLFALVLIPVTVGIILHSFRK